jgi:AcrR family transcriptional regulator
MSSLAFNLGFLDDATMSGLAKASGRKRAAPRPAEDRRREIVQAAVEVIGRRGVTALRLEDVAGQIGVAKTTVYLYFPTRDHLICAAVRDIAAHHLDPAAWCSATTDPSERLERFWSGLWDAATRPDVGAVFGAGPAACRGESPELAMLVSGGVLRLVTTLELLLRGLPAATAGGDPMGVARVLIGGVLASTQWESGPGARDDENRCRRPNLISLLSFAHRAG